MAKAQYWTQHPQFLQMRCANLAVEHSSLDACKSLGRYPSTRFGLLACCHVFKYQINMIICTVSWFDYYRNQSVHQKMRQQLFCSQFIFWSGDGGWIRQPTWLMT